MKAILFIIIIGLQCTVFAQNNYWQQRVNYIIDVTLNDEEHSLEGFEKLAYTNNSPDTLHFIWFHIWPNAFKNDQTAFSQQLLVNGRTDFYFSDKEQRGYINRLDFKVNGLTARTEDHPRHIDILKLVLPSPLAPGQSLTITTPFHVKLPYNFSRGGHVKQSYQITQWYPKPAVYDRKGWHPIAYLDQGEFYSEFGNYDVRITLPANYVVAATGELQNADELKWLKNKKEDDANVNATTTQNRQSATGNRQSAISNRQSEIAFPVSSGQLKTLQFLQNNVHDFAWFADKRFIVNHDTLMLLSGRVIDVFSYYLPPGKYWKKGISFLKDAITTRSAWLGEYPYNVVSAVEANMGITGGMEYPTITNLSGINSRKDLDVTIAHEVGHNWFYGILASNERLHPWMDEGFSTYYDKRYKAFKYSTDKDTFASLNGKSTFISKRLPDDIFRLAFETFAGLKKDQPINTTSEAFTNANYGLSAYYKTGEWLSKLEAYLGTEMFDSCMHVYYRRWQFKHPYPEDVQSQIESVSGKNIDTLFQELNTTGSLEEKGEKKLQLASLFNLTNTHNRNYISIAPAAGINMYDGLMIGGLLHNYQLPLNRFNFFVAPLYAVRSKKLNAIGRVSYSWFPEKHIYKIDAGVSASKFTVNEFEPEGKEQLFLTALKTVPFVRVTFKEPSILSSTKKYVQLKWFFLKEDQLDFRQVISGADTSNIVNIESETRNLSQLKFVVENSRVLYPYMAELNMEYQKDFFRLVFSGDYYFNYANGSNGLNVRLFGGKFLYTGAKTVSKQFETNRYHINLTGADGDEDYTYSNYFVGRNKFEKWGSQQIMIRDGGFKVNTDLLSNEVGKTDNWLLAANFSTGFPENINPLQVLPIKIPLKIFADIGTYAEAWQRDADLSRFLFDAGLQLSLLKETVNIYIPLMYSAVFKDYFKSTLGKQRFLKTISFSIDIQNFSLKKINRDMPF